jgi:hypothetical protein
MCTPQLPPYFALYRRCKNYPLGGSPDLLNESIAEVYVLADAPSGYYICVLTLRVKNTTKVAREKAAAVRRNVTGYELKQFRKDKQTRISDYQVYQKLNEKINVS